MATLRTTLKRPPQKKPKTEHPAITNARELLTHQDSTPLMTVQPEPVDVTLSPEIIKRKTGYKVVEEIWDYKQWRKIPVSQEFLHGLARKLIEWADKDDSYHWIYFCREYGIDINQFDGYVARYPILKQAKEQAREVIAARRDVDAYRMKASGSVMVATQSYHSESFKTHEAWKSNLKNPSALIGDVEYVINQPNLGTAVEDKNSNRHEPVQE